MIENNEKLISIDELIARAKNLGVNFGKGNPKNRLRYFVKIGLFPHAKRKSFNGLPPNGAYPESAIEILITIDKKLKEGKSVQEIKREFQENREFLEKYTQIYTSNDRRSFLEKIKKIIFEQKNFFIAKNFLKIFLPILLFTFLFLIFKEKIQIGKAFSVFLATVSRLEKIVQISSPISLPISQEKTFSLLSIEPYLTINAETVINSKLNVKDNITSPTFIIEKNGYKGNILISDLTSDRTYTLPNQSGIICLSTGNCVGLGGEVLTVGGTQNRIPKFITPTSIGNSSINDLYNGIAIFIDTQGNIGIGRENPFYKLHVQGRIQATGDICTDLAGGRCLSTLPIGGGGVLAGGGISGSGSTNYFPIWTGSTSLGNSIVSQLGSILNVAGTVKMTGFQLTTDAQEGYILTSDSSGIGTWKPAPSGTIPSGQLGYTLRHDGSNWIADGFLYNTGSAIGIGTTSTIATLTVAGSGSFLDSLTISTSNLPQFILQYDNNNYLKFSISSTSSEILASKTLVFNSLTGEMKFFNTSLKTGDKILRVSIPIFKFPVAAETASTTFTAISREISPTEINSVLPEQFSGSQRKFALLINFADDIPTNASSTWKIDFSTQQDIEFEFSGQNFSSLDEGVPHLRDNIENLLNDNWILQVKVPNSSNKIRIFNIFLLVYDQIQ